MKGSYNLIIQNNKVCYNLHFDRNITIIKGDSGIGKSTLLSLLSLYLDANGKKSGVHVTTNIKSLRILSGNTDWSDDMTSHPNSVYFADEFVQYVLTKEFYNKLIESGSYLVYITRSIRTGYLQYSISSIYTFSSIKNGNIYLNEMFNIYEDNYKDFKPDIILTEDSTSGLDMLSHSLSVAVDSSHGKDNMVNRVIETSANFNSIYIIVDGAAFGNQIQLLMDAIKNLFSCNVQIFAPESFEYLILNTSKFKKFCQDELENTYNYVDSSKYKTWETYFEDLLKTLCNKYTGVKYEKVCWDELNPFFKKCELLREISTQLKDIDKSIIL